MASRMDSSTRIDIRAARTSDRPADALLIRPDAHIAWAATADDPADTAALTLRQALADWFGEHLDYSKIETTTLKLKRA